MPPTPTESARRRFLHQAGVSLNVLCVGRTLAATRTTITARSVARVVVANNPIVVGVIGLGTMGTKHLRADSPTRRQSQPTIRRRPQPPRGLPCLHQWQMEDRSADPDYGCVMVNKNMFTEREFP